MGTKRAYPACRTRYSNGQLEAEMTPAKAGKQVLREWHPNGILASQKHFVNMREHGNSKSWNSAGELLGTNVFKHGTGTDREWYENGTIKSEMEFVRGEITGPMRFYDEDGKLFQTAYVYRGAFISKRRYLQKCE